MWLKSARIMRSHLQLACCGPIIAGLHQRSAKIGISLRLIQVGTPPMLFISMHAKTTFQENLPPVGGLWPVASAAPA